MFNVIVNLMDVLEIYVGKRNLCLEPLVTMGKLSSTLTTLGWTVAVLSEIDDLTVGGLTMGTGMKYIYY